MPRRSHVVSMIVLMRTGGGGFHPAVERAPERVASDVRQGYVSIAAAERDYGVVIDPEDGTLDETRTAERRASMEA